MCAERQSDNVIFSTTRQSIRWIQRPDGKSLADICKTMDRTHATGLKLVRSTWKIHIMFCCGICKSAIAINDDDVGHMLVRHFNNWISCLFHRNKLNNHDICLHRRSVFTPFGPFIHLSFRDKHHWCCHSYPPPSSTVTNFSPYHAIATRKLLKFHIKYIRTTINIHTHSTARRYTTHVNVNCSYGRH